MTDRESSTRRAMVLSELLTGPAEDLRSESMGLMSDIQNPNADADSEIDALWTALEALWLHYKALQGSLGSTDFRGPAWMRPPYD